MWHVAAVTQLLQIAYPIIQGPFGGGLSSVELTAAVSNLGGLGSFGAHFFCSPTDREYCGTAPRVPSRIRVGIEGA